MDYISLTLSGIAIVGAIFNASGHKYILMGFILWIISNTGFAIVTILNGWWEQTPLWIAYNVVSVYGLLKWRQEMKKVKL